MGSCSVQRGLLTWAALAGLARGLFGAESEPEAARAVVSVSYRVSRYTAEQGLPQNTVRALLQSSDGYLWVGTLAGLARFDGVRFTVFDLNNTPEMLHDSINALAEDRRDGSLWINTGKGLLRYHQHRFERFDTEDGVPQPFGRLWPAQDGGLWFSPRPGELVLLRNGSVRTWQVGPGKWDLFDLAHRIVQVEEESGGSLLVLMHAGLLRFEPATGAVTQLGPWGLPDTQCRHFLKESDGTILLAAQNGLLHLDSAGWERIETAPLLAHQGPDRICRARDGGLWIPWRSHSTWSEAVPPRVTRFQAGRSELLDLSQIPDYPLNDFLEDREGHLWLGTESGLCQLRPQGVRVYARENGLRNDDVRSLTQGPDGTIWLGTAAGVSGIKNGQVTNLPPIAPSMWGRAEGLLADGEGRLWYGVHYETVAIFAQGAWVPGNDVSPRKGWLRTLYQDRRGRIWAGSDLGVAWLDEAGLGHTLPHPLSHPDVRVIHQDRRGDMWFGTYGGGLNRLHEDTVTSYTTDLGEYNNRAWCIHEDDDGVFWVGTRYGLNRFVPPGIEGTTEPGDHGTDRQGNGGTKLARSPRVVLASERPMACRDRFFTFTTLQGLHENVINNVQEDDFGYLWLSGLQGIYRVSRRELNDVAAGRRERVEVLAFGEADGMLNSQCNGGVNQPSGCKDRAGCIWFPTARGVAMIDPRTIHRNEVPPPVIVEQVKANDVIVYGDCIAPGAARRLPSSLPTAAASAPPRAQGLPAPETPLRLGPGRARVLEIRYTGNSFAAPQQMRFRFRLVGHEKDWRYDDQNRVAFYTNLRPGAYQFQVSACNNHGVWSQTPAVFLFTLAPHFWQTWVFYVLAGGVAVGVAAAIQAYRLRWQRRLLKVEQQQALADERTRIARDLHDDLGTALTGLALQLDVLRRTTPEGPALAKLVAESAARIRTLAEHMREVVWAVNPSCDSVPSLASFLEQQAGQFKSGAPRCRLDFPEDIPSMPLDSRTRHQLALGVREALTNAVRHAAASEIVLALRVEAGQLIVRVTDDGRGFCAEECRALGHGLSNMRARLERVGGRCHCHSAPGLGTVIELRVPLHNERSLDSKR